MQRVRDVRRAAPLPACPTAHCLPPVAEGALLADQAAAVKEFAEFVSQLRRVGTGLGVFEFDRQIAAKA